MFSVGGTASAPRAANCIMFDGNFEARIWSIMRPIGSQLPPGFSFCHSARGKVQASLSSISSLTVRNAFQLPHRPIQFASQPVWLAPQEFVQQNPIVPKSAFAPTIEPRPDGFADFTV